MLTAAKAIDVTDATPFESCDDDFFDRLAGVSLEEADETAEVLTETVDAFVSEDFE